MDNVLEVENLSITFKSDEGTVRAIDGVNFSLAPGRTLGLVGESGSGKSVSTKALMRLLPSTATLDPQTAIRYRNKAGETVNIEAIDAKSRRLRHLRGGEIGMIFQEPMASFSPVYTIGAQMVETIRLHRKMDKRTARKTAIEMLDVVGIANPESRFDAYAFEMSGGMRQRAMIALALSAEPALLIADEPTTALDVTIQAQVLELMRSLQERHKMAMIFITHDLGVIAQIADDVAVMYLGTIVERGATREVINNPKHPYTVGLLNAIPSMVKLTGRMQPVPGDIPNPSERPSGCPFRSRCDHAMPGICDKAPPPEFTPVPGHAVRCYLFDESVSREAAQ